MNLTAIVLTASLFLAYSLVSRRLDSTFLTAPLIFTIGGILFTALMPDVFSEAADHGYVHILAELTLILVLFSDAASIRLNVLRKDHSLPLRMLGIGLPLTVILGTITAFFMFGVLSIWEAALLGAILAPTDAALGQAVVTDKAVPLRIRQAISVESGLNDGLGLPLVVIFAAVCTMEGKATGAAELAQFTVLQVTLGPLVGIAVGYVGAKLIDTAVDKNLIAGSFEGIAALCVAVGSFALAESVHGNGFIAAFIAGLVFGNTLSHQCKFLFEFAESEGQFFTLSTFLIFGMVAFELIGESFEWIYLVYGLLSLTLIRMIPIALSLIGTGTETATKGFLGWFGPRGLASILFALLIIEKENIQGGPQIVSIVVVTVLMSVLLHGVSSTFLSNLYGSYIAKKGTCMEMKDTEEPVVKSD